MSEGPLEDPTAVALTTELHEQLLARFDEAFDRLKADVRAERISFVVLDGHTVGTLEYAKYLSACLRDPPRLEVATALLAVRL